MQQDCTISLERNAMSEGGIRWMYFDAFSSKSSDRNILINTYEQGCSIAFWCCSFTGKERDEETGFGYFGARYMDHELMTMWLSVDPLADKYPSISPYAYCVWNPVKLTDPDGMDTLNVTYNNTTKRWDIGTLVIAQGNDVINVTKSNGLTGSVVFSEGEYGKRICNVTLEDNGQQTLSVFMLSGEGVAGYAVEPSGVADNSKSYDNDGVIVPIECGVYSIGTVGGSQWNGWPEQYNKTLAKGRGVAMHYAWSRKRGSKQQGGLAAKDWSTKCAVVSSAYTMDSKGVVLYEGNQSKAMAQKVARYCGATGFIPRPGQYDQCVGISKNGNGVIRIVK